MSSMILSIPPKKGQKVIHHDSNLICGSSIHLAAPAVVALAHVEAPHDEIKVLGRLVVDIGTNRPGVEDVLANHSLYVV